MKYAFIANQGTAENPSNLVTRVDLESKTVTATIDTGKGTQGLLLDLTINLFT